MIAVIFEVRPADGRQEAYLDLAAKLVDEGRWGDLYDMGLMLFTAHRLVLAKRAAVAAENTGVAGGGQLGIQTSKSVDGVSVSYDVSSVTMDKAGHYNASSYGLQFVQMARMVGAGPIHVGNDTAIGNSGQAWPGVVYPHF